MASSSTNPPAAPDPFDLGIHTPANLNRGARAILLRDSPAVVNTPIGVSHGPERTAQTPSSPLNAATFATATEGAERTNPPLIFEQQPISIIESANELARERVEEYNAKLMVFQAFCAKFEEAAQQFTNGPQRRFAQQFADSFLDSWKRELSGDMPTSKPTYSSVAASHPSDRARPAQQHQQQQRRRSDPPHRQGQQTTVAPPRQDLRVFVRLEAGAPARDHSSYAIRTLIQEKLGTVSDKIRQVFQVRSGWAILTADSETRDFLVEKQAEWAAELGATAVETNKEWHTYVVSDFPRRLTDFRGNKVDSDSVVSDEIEIQTGLKPVDIRTGRQLSDNPLTKTLLVSFLKPTKKRLWSLFGSRAARLIDKTDVPKQCETCWGYHFARNCHRQPVCQRCGKTGHIVDDCAAWEQCVNCLGPHEASLRNCPARPKRVRGILRRLTKEQREHIRMVGAETYRQRHLNPQPESLTEIQQSTTELPRDDIALDQQSNARTPSPAASGAPSCIMVATAPRTGYEAEEEPEHPRPGSPLNFYRQNDERDALNTLLRWPVPERCLVAGDFNARHHSWQTGQATNRGQEIADWALEQELSLLNTLDIPTNPYGNTIDLAFTNLPLAEATVEDHLATSSDHFTLSLTFPEIRSTTTQSAKIRVTTEDEVKRFVEIVELGATEIPVTDSTPKELDELASSLVNLLTSAVKAAGRPARRGGRPAPWWTEECADAAAAFRAVRRSYPLGFNQDVQTAKRDLHRVVRRAKRKYWRDLIDSFSSSSAVFKAVRWLKSPGAFQPPPLQVDNVVYETQMDKANALRQATTRLRRTDELLASCTRPKLVQRYFHKEQIPSLQIASKEKSADAFIRWVESLDSLTLVVYSDGSLSSEGVASYGFTIHQNNVPIFDGSGRLGPAEVFDAEATGALEGLKAALNLRDAATQNIFICLDNLAAATCLRGTPSGSSQNVFLEFQALTTSHGAIQVRWSQAAAMASFTASPPAATDPFDMGIHTPANLNRGARAALLQNSPATVNGTIGVLPVPGRMAQTPSSPLIAATAAAATEGAARANSSSIFEQRPISIIESASDLAREHAEEYNAKLMVFQTFCAKFEEAAQQFATGPQRRFARQFADSFLDIWKRELSGPGPTTPKPTYSSVAATSLPAAHVRPARHHQQQQHRQSDPPHRQGQQTNIAPPRQDLRVFIRLEAEAPARAHSGYAIRTLIREKLGAVSDKIRQVFQVRSGWAVLAADLATRDFLVEKQAEWAAELKPIAVETNKEWFTYVVSDFPKRLTDFHGNEVDSDSIVSDEIEIQTGLTPVDIRPARQFSDNPLTKGLLVSFLKPIKRFWSLFGSSAARLVNKTNRLRQCETCWGYHFARSCYRQPVCQRCGKTGHSTGDCAAPEQCVNCLGPHQANFDKCPNRPKKVRGVLRRLTKEQRGHVRTVGAEAYRQRQRERESQPESHQEAYNDTSERQGEDDVSQDQPSVRAPSPAVSGAPSCIMVATTPQIGYEAEEEPEHPRPGSPRKRRIQTRKNDKKPLRIFQANVGKIPPAHDCALALADSERYDIVLLQEPWTSHTESRFLTKTHPAYDTFTPVDMWSSNDTRPRVMTYVRRDSRLATPSQPGKIRVTTEDELKRFVEIVELGATEIPGTGSTSKELDELASSLVCLLTSAAKAAGRPARKGGRPAPWWTEECAVAVAAFRAIRRLYPVGFNQDVQIAKRDFHSSPAAALSSKLSDG
ncbi:hypothetical protein FocTR4_00017206 [Fusarium oxysporum f. sp. cubense]|uniref:CCHC-type domain-containing protein n=1 Tax=Fusarium oxysporum f. sp. cubense TaxID=61366 RepID=A0A5C6SHW6_FUSOC|nr:hypothetical protein FocTR4_00017206 [Fusarium oxysporum f. sp. cubense]